MTPTFVKLNLKEHTRIAVLNAPASFEPDLAALHGVTVVRDLAETGELGFALAFVTQQRDVDNLGKAIAKSAKGDAVVWFAYPKGSSKQYKSEINRDSGWKALGTAGFEPVRMVAIDADWSALRFRRVEFIKTMTRAKEHRMSPGGQARAGKARPAKRG